MRIYEGGRITPRCTHTRTLSDTLNVAHVPLAAVVPGNGNIGKGDDGHG